MTARVSSLFAALLAAGLSLLAPLRGQAQPASAREPTARRPRFRSTPSACRPACATPQDHGFLWRIAKDGRTSYLYGTLHAAQPAWMFPGPRTTAALEASDVLALELDLLDPDVRERLIKAANARPDERAARGAGDARRAAHGGRVRRRRRTWRDFVPEFQIASLAVMAARRDGLDPSYAIDLVLALMARDFGKATASLETPEAQIAALRMPSARGDDRVRDQRPRRARRRQLGRAARRTWRAPGPTATSPSSKATSAGATASTPPPSAPR